LHEAVSLPKLLFEAVQSPLSDYRFLSVLINVSASFPRQAGRARVFLEERQAV
jgi:hypothetical protein